MSDDIKRKEFLDELFSFMQKRGEYPMYIALNIQVPFSLINVAKEKHDNLEMTTLIPFGVNDYDHYIDVSVIIIQREVQ